MADELNQLLESNSEAKKYYLKLPQYVRDAVKKHETEINSAESLRLFADTFMKDDSFRGA